MHAHDSHTASCRSSEHFVGDDDDEYDEEEHYDEFWHSPASSWNGVEGHVGKGKGAGIAGRAPQVANKTPNHPLQGELSGISHFEFLTEKGKMSQTKVIFIS